MRRALIAAGSLIFSYGVIGLLTGDGGDLPGVVVFGLAVLALHDGVLLPLILAGGALIARVVPARWRTAVRLAAIVGVALTVIAVPLQLGPGLRAYGKNLILILLVVTVTVLASRKGFERVRTGAGGTGPDNLRG
ncbi:hypothetical protein ACTOB_005017 [Actinoplanes oblitus]|uniref:Uncharacterized protein n=1 Tax=Actinoplanes oblitus TaxID=3040509 RepID=A0ABY8W6A9_9ACTN|nr:hypothetical protein [Actinoplanes oblitus]WIM93052.1 hypothetical protein ACTOB_005017 [Actinoplanes oblitus]